MAFYIINTDHRARRDVRTCDLWFKYGMAFAGDEEGHDEHTAIFKKLQPRDTLFMWHSGLGCVGVGTIPEKEKWDGRVYESEQRLLYVSEPYEYRIVVDWIQDWRETPKSGEHGLPVPRGGSWQKIDGASFPVVHVYSCGNTIQTFREYDDHFQKAISSSHSDSDDDRRKRLESSDPSPRVTTVLTTVFQRNPDVVVEVLRRANGICEGCSMAAPFTRKSDGSPYLEVHHIETLSSGGSDTVKNAQALCPNCHRKAHFG